MRFLVACLCALLVSQATCMTNREFTECMLQSAEDVEELYPGDEDFDDTDDGAIELPGAPDDEVDLEYLMLQTGVPDMLVSKLSTLSNTESGADALGMYRTTRGGDLGMYRTTRGGDLGWFRRRRRRSSSKPIASCKCKGKSCNCCLTKEFKLNLGFKKYKYKLNACADIVYKAGDGVEVKFKLSNKPVFTKKFSLKNPPPMCYTVKLAKVCLDLRNVNPPKKSFCVYLTGSVNFIVKKLKFGFKIGCVKLAAFDEGEINQLISDPTALTRVLSDNEDSELANIHSLADLMQFVEITEMPNGDVTDDADDLMDSMEIAEFNY